MAGGREDRHRAAAAAVRRFPRFELAIHQLIDRDEGFRDLCEELADAEFALASVDKAPPALREARRAEWQELVDRLVGEVEVAMRKMDAAARLRVVRSPPR
jgi:hypothetical protein